MDIFRGGSWEPGPARTAGLGGMNRVAVRPQTKPPVKSLAQAAPSSGNPVADAQQGVEIANRVAEAIVSNYSSLIAVVGEAAAERSLDDAEALLNAAEASLVEAQTSVPMVSER
jgi:hypothetical protein